MSHTVLLVDDEPYVLSSMKRGFEFRKAPFETLCASSAKEALIILEAQDIDLVVSDQDMPRTSGTVLLAEIHKTYPDTIRYMLTGQGTLDIAIQAINSGAISRFFTKPCLIADLAVSIRQSLEHKELMVVAKQLLQIVRRQSTELERLERQYSDITKLDIDYEGFTTVKNNNMSIEELLHERCHKIPGADM